MGQTKLHLVKENRSKDREAFAEIYDKYAEKIYNFIYYKTYHRETAEDITAATFLKALDNWHRYDPAKGSAATWLYTIARNLVVDFYRKKRQTVDIEDIWDLASGEDVAVDAHNRQQLEEVRGIMRNLPADQRNILIMRIWQDMPYRAIAEVTGKSEAACKMAFSRTIARLRGELTAMALVLLYLFKFTV